MKSTIKTDEDQIISTPLLFTPTQRKIKRRSSHTDSSNENIRCLSPTTPGVHGLYCSPNLPEGAKECSSKISKNHSFLIDILKSNQSKKESDSTPSCSRTQHNEWFFDTPSILRSSPSIPNQGVSRRSLDRILDPDVSFSWIESMATPPTQSAGKNQTVIEENDDVLSGIDKDDDLVLCDNLTDSDLLLDDPSHVNEGHSPTASKLSKKGVARVLFDFGEKDETKSGEEELNANNDIAIKPEDLPMFLSSEEDDPCSMSPPVVKAKDNMLMSKGRTASKGMAVLSGWSDMNPKIIGLPLKSDLQKSQSSPKQAESRRNESRLTIDLDLISTNEMTTSGISDLPSTLSSPTVVFKCQVNCDKEAITTTTTTTQSNMLLTDRIERSEDRKNTLPSPLAIVSKRKRRPVGSNKVLNQCVEDDGLLSSQHSVPFDDVSNEQSRLKNTNNITANVWSSSEKSYSDEATVHSDAKCNENRSESSSIYQTPVKLSLSVISSISGSSMSPTVVSRSNREFLFSPVNTKAETVNVVQSTPKISKCDLDTGIVISDTSLQGCPFSPGVLEKSEWERKRRAATCYKNLQPVRDCLKEVSYEDDSDGNDNKEPEKCSAAFKEPGTEASLDRSGGMLLFGESDKCYAGDIAIYEEKRENQPLNLKVSKYPQSHVEDANKEDHAASNRNEKRSKEETRSSDIEGRSSESEANCCAIWVLSNVMERLPCFTSHTSDADTPVVLHEQSGISQPEMTKEKEYTAAAMEVGRTANLKNVNFVSDANSSSGCGVRCENLSADTSVSENAQNFQSKQKGDEDKGNTVHGDENKSENSSVKRTSNKSSASVVALHEEANVNFDNSEAHFTCDSSNVSLLIGDKSLIDTDCCTIERLKVSKSFEDPECRIPSLVTNALDKETLQCGSRLEKGINDDSLNDVSLPIGKESWKSEGVTQQPEDISTTLIREVGEYKLGNSFCLDTTPNKVSPGDLSNSKTIVDCRDINSRCNLLVDRDTTAKRFCKDNIVDMDALTQFPYDEVSNSFSKEDVIYRTTVKSQANDSDSQPICEPNQGKMVCKEELCLPTPNDKVYCVPYGEEKREMECDGNADFHADQLTLRFEKNHNLHSDKCLVEDQCYGPKEVLSSRVLHEKDREEQDQKRDKYAGKELPKEKKKSTDSCDSKSFSHISSHKWNNSEFSIPTKPCNSSLSHQRKVQVKQSRQLSDSSTEDMLEELMFGRNGPCPKKRKLDVSLESSFSNQHILDKDMSRCERDSGESRTLPIEFANINFIGNMKRSNDCRLDIEAAKMRFENSNSDKYHKQSKTHLISEGFHTGTGKAIKISTNAIDKAMLSFSEVNDTVANEYQFTKSKPTAAIEVHDDVKPTDDHKSADTRDSRPSERQAEKSTNHTISDRLQSHLRSPHHSESKCVTSSRDLVISEAENKILSDCMINNDFDIEDFTQLRDTHDDFKPYNSIFFSPNTKLEDIPLSSSLENVLKFDGFSTGSGKKVEVSKKAIEAAKKRLETDNEYQDGDFDSSKKSSERVKFDGFSTGSGKKVEVSKKAIEAAKKRLETVNEYQDDDFDSSKKSSDCLKFDGFSTGSGKKVEVSKKAIEAAKKRLETVDEYQDGDFDSSKKSSERVKFDGFSTGSGKKVKVSKKAIEAAKKRLETVDEYEDDNFDSSKKSSERLKFDGFSTGSGKKVEVSKKAIEAAKKRLETVDEYQDGDFDSSKKSSERVKFDGFSTGNGKKVKVSKKALEAAKKRLETVDEYQDGDFDSSKKSSERVKFDGFSTGSGKKVKVSKKAIEAAKKRLETVDEYQDGDFDSSKKSSELLKFDGFSTGSGKKVEVSKKAIEAAKKRLESVDKYEDDDFDSLKMSSDCLKFGGFSTGSGKKVEVSKKAIEAAKKRLETVDEYQDGDFDSSKKSSERVKFDGFSTGSGKKVEVSKKAIEAAKKRLETVDEYQDGDFDSSKKSSERLKFDGFSTGSGKKVEVSKKAIEAAKKRLETVNEYQDDDFDSSKKSSECLKFDGFSTGSGKKVEVSKEAIEATKKRLGNVDKCQNDDFDSSKKSSDCFRFDGFSTGSGKKVEVSKKAIEAAKKRLESVDKYEDDPLRTTSAQSVENISNKADDRRKKTKNKLEGEDTSLQQFDKDNFVTPSIKQSENIKGSSSMKRTYTRADQNINPGSKANENVSENLDESFIEMSERFDNDVMKVIDEDPYFLNVRRKLTVFGKKSTADGLADTSENSLQKSDLKEFKETHTTPHGSVVNTREQLERPHLKDENLYSRTSRSKLKANSKYRFKAKLSTPTGYQSDRLAKFTTPLIAKSSCIEDINTPMLTRSVPPTANQAPYSLPSKTKHKTPEKPTRSHQTTDSRTKSFSTPFNSKHRNSKEPSSDAAVGVKKRVPKRPLFSCVPFSNKRQRLEDTSNDRKMEENTTKRQSGRFFSMKKQNRSRTQLSDCSFGKKPCSYSKEEVFNFGANKDILDVSSENSQSFVFRKDFFSEETIARSSTTIGDGAQLSLSGEGSAGLKEFQIAFKTLPGVDSSLFTEEWLANQYRWIVWKLASMERSFPDTFAGRCLTPNEVMYHLKYRYDKEIDSAERPALKKILERDDVSSRRLVLCVSKIYTTDQLDMQQSKDETGNGKEKKTDNQQCIIELTDGWYPVKAALDKPLTHLLNTKKIKIGLKLCVYGADLTGSEQACPPLEAPDSLMLLLHANSTRRARWDAKLGYQADRRAFPVPLHSLYPDGGLVGCIDVVVIRSYPTQWMEKSENGFVFRNSSQEQKAAKKYNEQKQTRMEKLYAKIQKELENSSQPQGTRRSKRRSLYPSAKELQNINSGQELYEILNSTSDLASVEIILSDSQKELVAQFRMRKTEEQNAAMQQKFDDAWKEIQEGFPERCVVSLQKFRVADYKHSGRAHRSDSFITIWKPKEEMREIWKEGARLKIFNVSASVSRYKHTKSTVQLATMNTTRFEELKAAPGSLESFYSRRMIKPNCELMNANELNEVDVVGYVVYIEQHGSMSELQTVYIADASDTFVAVKVWGGAKLYNIEDILQPGNLVCMQNLVLKSESHYGFAVVVTYCDLSTACRHPKEAYLKQAVVDLQSRIKDVTNFLKDRAEYLRSRLPTGSRSVRFLNTPKTHDFSSLKTPEYSSGRITPCSSTGRPIAVDKMQGRWNANTPKQNQSYKKGNLTPINSSSCEDCKDSVVLDAQKRLNDMKRRALTRYGEPDGLSTSPANITPKARRAFKPPSVKKT